MKTTRGNVSKHWCSLTYTVILSLLVYVVGLVNSDDGFCPIKIKEDGLVSGDCENIAPDEVDNSRYIVYKVNEAEGFNLRRDVYVRMAVFINKLNKQGGNWVLVLPPWDSPYHWKSQDVGPQHQLPWNKFFDLDSLQNYAPVIDFYELFVKFPSRITRPLLDQVYVLQHFKGTWEKDFVWEDKWAIEPCSRDVPYSEHKTGLSQSHIFKGYKNLTAAKIDCVSFQGPALQLREIVKQTDAKIVMIDHAEVVLHDAYGQAEYWKARRSMRYRGLLYQYAELFRVRYLDPSNDVISLPSNWLDEKPKSNPRGGSYLAVHLRQGDFLWSRQEETPTLESAALQIKSLLKKLNFTTAFVATDATTKEFLQLQSMLNEYAVYKYSPSGQEEKKDLLDGGIAIVEQILCSRASYFIGSHESTFSFRIQEDREILGFDKDTTFNRLCGINKECVQPTRWGIIW